MILCRVLGSKIWNNTYSRSAICMIKAWKISNMPFYQLLSNGFLLFFMQVSSYYYSTIRYDVVTIHVYTLYCTLYSAFSWTMCLVRIEPWRTEMLPDVTFGSDIFKALSTTVDLLACLLHLKKLKIFRRN